MWSCVLGLFSSKHTTHEHVISITGRPRLLKTSTRGSLTKKYPQVLLWWWGWNCCGCANWKLCQILSCLESERQPGKLHLINLIIFPPLDILGQTWRNGYPYTEINTHIQTWMHTDEHSNADVNIKTLSVTKYLQFGGSYIWFHIYYLIFFSPQQQNMDDINVFLHRGNWSREWGNNLPRVSKLQRNRIFLYDCA